MMMDPKHRSQVENALERPLTDEELAAVSDLAALPPAHFSVVEQLYRRSPIEAFYYLLAVIGDDDRSAVRNYVHGFDSLVAQRNPRRKQLARFRCGSKLGRELTDDEWIEATSLDSLTPAARDVARALAATDRGDAESYLYQLVPSASDAERAAFLDSLAGAA